MMYVIQDFIIITVIVVLQLLLKLLIFITIKIIIEKISLHRCKVYEYNVIILKSHRPF